MHLHPELVYTITAAACAETWIGRDRILLSAHREGLSQKSRLEKEAASHKMQCGMQLRSYDVSAADSQGSVHGLNANHEIKGHSIHLLFLKSSTLNCYPARNPVPFADNSAM